MGLMLQNIKKRFTKGTNFIKAKTLTPRKKMTTYARKHPFITLFSLLGLLVILIIISNFFQQPPAELEETQADPKQVEVYHIGEAPKITVQAQVEKSGVVTITALSPGVVQQIYAEPGTEVTQGTTLLSTSTNYQGGNALALQASIAARQLQNIDETYDSQKDLIAKQKDLANKTEENAEELREITRKSLEDTRGLLSLNDEILESINNSIEAATTDEEKAMLQQLKSNFLAANNQLRSSLRNAEYSSDEEETPAELSELGRQITIKQLEIQEKALDLNRDVTRLQYQVAQVQAATMAPSAPFNAIVQRVNVTIGEAVQPGTPLMVLSQKIEEDPIVAIAYVPQEIARKVSYMEPSILQVGDFEYESYPSYITQDAINGSLYGVYYPIPDMYHQQLTNDGYISVEMPIGFADTGSAVPFIPIDSVYQTENESYVYLVQDNKAVSRPIRLGNVIGRFVEVIAGLDSGDVIILDRRVVGGDEIKIVE